MNVVKVLEVGYKVFAGVAVSYTTFRLLEKKAVEMEIEGNTLSAFAIGAGHMGLAMTAGYIAAETLGPKAL